MNAHAVEDLLEQRINDACECLVTAKTREGKQAAWERMKELIAKRSAEAILRMERERGLR